MRPMKRAAPPFAPPARPDNDGKTLAGTVDEFASWEAAAKTPMELRLQSGECWRGWNFGAKRSVAGEVVFCTAMMGYPESLTDPSFAGQILVLTYPLVGNYGVPPDENDELGIPRYFEGSKIFPVAVVVSEYSFVASHYSAVKSLSQWLEEHKVPGIFGVDTRAITKRLRMEGSALGAVVMGSDSAPAWVDPNVRNLVAEVSVSSPKLYVPPKDDDGDGSDAPLVIAVDCGMKFNIVRFFVYYLRVRLKESEEFDGLFISNGPGDPEKCDATVKCLQQVMKDRPRLPIFGICLGHQLLSLAAGCKTYKMKFGNRGVNQPCIDLRTGRCYITSQNHGFAVDDSNLPEGWHSLFVNANDGSNEGIAHKEKPWLSVQFHPEACCGPVDTAFLFDEFLRILRDAQGRSLTTISYKHPQAITKVLVLGSGGLTIGQAGEFDYSGSQAIKALREQHVQSVLINPNIATVQTSKGLADQIFFVPVTPEFVTKVIEKVRPDGLFAAFGGQTALNCAVQLHRNGTLKKYGVKVLGTQIDSIVATEDRDVFKAGVESIGEQCALSACADTVEEAKKAAKDIGFPVLVRAAFALGGLGSGFASNEEELDVLLERAFANSSQVIIDECLKGWKELEYEVMRDSKDNCLVVCNMENLDPMGIHTGESIVVAPSQTLSNDEYHHLRAVAIKVIRHFGIVGEANIQYALDPFSKRYRIVEVNARLSRSSALASKATGYPLAYVAAKIALGHDLVSLRNLVTRCTTACFEPSLDYCVVKIPRWDIDKFPTVERTLGTQMKSVGEVMSIARSFPEAIQKALRMVNEGSVGFDESWYLRARTSAGTSKENNVEEEMRFAGPLRLWAIAHAFNTGFSVEKVYEITKIDRWFLGKLFSVHQARKRMESMGSLSALKEAGPEFLLRVKQLGFCDRQIAKAVKDTDLAIMHLRAGWNVRPCVKQVDTLAAEFPAQTNYLYLTYVGSQNDVVPLRTEKLAAHKDLDSLYDTAFGKGRLQEESGFNLPTKKSGVQRVQTSPSFSPRKSAMKTEEPPPPLDLNGEAQKPSFIVLGSGCYRIGASVEFDWSSVSAVRTLRETGHRAMVINCNPETVSTDYDESDRLYFEELTLETVLEICNFEQPAGTIVSVGGQTPNNLAPKLDKMGINILGTAAQNIDRAEDRSKFSAMCDELGIDQPEWSEFVKMEEALSFAHMVGFPVLVRPSYVLSGAAMRVIDNEDQLKAFLGTSAVAGMLETLDQVKNQLQMSSHGIAELCYEHREWQRSIEMMLSIIEDSITMPTLLKTDQRDWDVMHEGEGCPGQDTERQGKTSYSSYNSTSTPGITAITPHRGNKTSVLSIPSLPSVPSAVPISAVPSVLSERKTRHLQPRPRSFRGSLLQSRNTVKHCPAGPLRKLLMDLLNTPEDVVEGPSRIRHARKVASEIVSSSWFEYASGFVILLNVITIGLEAELSLEGSEWESSYWFAGSERIFLSIYCAEAIFRAFGLGRILLSDGWYILDLFLIFVVMLTLAVVPMLANRQDIARLRKLLVIRGLRLLRLMRVCRMIHHFKIIWRLVYGFLTSWQTIFATAALILVSIYVFSCIAVEIIAKDSDLTANEITDQIVSQNFWGIGRSMLTIFQFVTLDGLREIYYPLVIEKPWLSVYFFAIVLVISIGLLNIVTACVVQTATANAAASADEERSRLKGQVCGALPQLIAIFNELDTDGSGLITHKKVEHVPVDILPRRILESIYADTMGDVFDLLDVNESGFLTEIEFTEGLLNLCLLDTPIATIQILKLLKTIHNQQTSLEHHLHGVLRENSGHFGVGAKTVTHTQFLLPQILTLGSLIVAQLVIFFAHPKWSLADVTMFHLLMRADIAWTASTIERIRPDCEFVECTLQGLEIMRQPSKRVVQSNAEQQ
eukprot:s1743_g4.t1